MQKCWIFQQSIGSTLEKKFICMWWRKLLISLQSEWWECAQTAQPSASGIFVCPSHRLFVSLSYVCSACILSGLICIVWLDAFLLLCSQLHLKRTFAWIKTEHSSYRACKFLYVVIFVLFSSPAQLKYNVVLSLTVALKWKRVFESCP